MNYSVLIRLNVYNHTRVFSLVGVLSKGKWLDIWKELTKDQRSLISIYAIHEANTFIVTKPALTRKVISVGISSNDAFYGGRLCCKK